MTLEEKKFSGVPVWACTDSYGELKDFYQGYKNLGPYCDFEWGGGGTVEAAIFFFWT
jgi:hypothetical protein